VIIRMARITGAACSVQIVASSAFRPRENVELRVDEHSLAITGSLREDEGEKVMRRRTGRFFYRTVLPRDIDTEKVQATMKEGILTIRLPKTKQATRRVQIRA